MYVCKCYDTVSLIAMWNLLLLLLIVCSCGTQESNYDETMLFDQFPDGFVWGAATAAYQVSIIIITVRNDSKSCIYTTPLRLKVDGMMMEKDQVSGMSLQKYLEQ